MDAIADAILALHHDISAQAQSIPPRKVIELVWHRSEPRSMLRKLFLDILSWTGDEDIFDYTPPVDGVDVGDGDIVDENIWDLQEAPQSIVCDVWRRLLAPNKAVRAGKASLTTLATAKACDYHEHGPNRGCRSLKRKRENEESEIAEELPRRDRCKIRKLEAELEQAKGEIERLLSAVPGAPSAWGRPRS
ncbi:hypothetical protein Slin15195_G124940 [Septoria linicola]|uniref:Uncharacterized protein n=1 Tax=Septoria linicola TaxID=215465 RepID=A0A9Q9EQI9_9PEZI|nr:hypothetical protein Slin14017_G081130 [Septoria linicola]USW59175.1 hypothetical protein Slin15195_G124940 [Septoria linicola]